MCAAGFQRDIQGCPRGLTVQALRASTSACGSPCAGVETFSDDAAVLDDDCADGRIGPCTADGVLREATPVACMLYPFALSL